MNIIPELNKPLVNPHSPAFFLLPCSLILPAPPSLSVHLLAVLVFFLLELPEVGLDGRGGLLNLNGAEWRDIRRGTRPIAGNGVWARQDTGDSHRGRGNSHGDKVCSNDWVQTHGLLISFYSAGYFSDFDCIQLERRSYSNQNIEATFRCMKSQQKNSQHLN